MSEKELAYVSRVARLGAEVTVKQAVILTRIGERTHVRARRGIFEMIDVEEATGAADAVVANLVHAINEDTQ